MPPDRIGETAWVTLKITSCLCRCISWFWAELWWKWGLGGWFGIESAGIVKVAVPRFSTFSIYCKLGMLPSGPFCVLCHSNQPQPATAILFCIILYHLPLLSFGMTMHLCFSALRYHCTCWVPAGCEVSEDGTLDPDLLAACMRPDQARRCKTHTQRRSAHTHIRRGTLTCKFDYHAGFQMCSASIQHWHGRWQIWMEPLE